MGVQSTREEVVERRTSFTVVFSEDGKDLYMTIYK